MLALLKGHVCVCTIYGQREEHVDSNTTHKDLILQLPRKKKVEKSDITLQRVCSSQVQRRRKKGSPTADAALRSSRTSHGQAGLA